MVRYFGYAVLVHCADYAMLKSKSKVIDEVKAFLHTLVFR